MKNSLKRSVVLISSLMAVNAFAIDKPLKKSWVNSIHCSQQSMQRVAESLQNTVVTEATMLSTPVEHCQVIGHVTTDNPGPNQVNFKVLLPTEHNNRFYFQGWGGSAGSLENPSDPVLEKGYAVAVTDTGNQSAAPGSGGGLDWRFMFDEAKALDYDRRGGHVATVAAQALTRAYYGLNGFPRGKHHRGKLWRYHSGCSGGGRMGISAAVEYPDDYDGIVLGAPGRTLANILHFGKVAQYVQNNIDLTTDPAPLLNMIIAGNLIEQQWDAADGAIDGQIWDPSVVDISPEQLDQLLALGGEISDEWRTVLDMVQEGYDLRHLGGIVNIGPYYLSSIIEWPLWTPQELAPGVFFFFPNQVFGTVTQGAFGPDYNFIDSWDFNSAYDELALLEEWDNLNFAKQNSGADFSKFRNKGGKLLIWHGVHDAAIAYESSVKMYEDLVAEAKLGFGKSRWRGKLDEQHAYNLQLRKTQRWARLFPVPGIGHCQNGVAGDGPDDTSLAALEALADWVEKGRAPEAITAEREADGRTFKLCPYPGRSVFKGGVENPENLDVNDANNWYCEH